MEISPRMMGGSSRTNIVCTNINGYPSNKGRRHKEKDIKKLTKDQDKAIILETGVNNKSRMADFIENLNIAQENKMKEIMKNV